MKRNYSALSFEVKEFSVEDVIRTSGGEDYSKDVVVGNEDFTDGLVGGFGNFNG